jgi:hypothetical protein
MLLAGNRSVAVRQLIARLMRGGGVMYERGTA